MLVPSSFFLLQVVKGKNNNIIIISIASGRISMVASSTHAYRITRRLHKLSTMPDFTFLGTMLHSTENQRLSTSNFLECHHSGTTRSITPMTPCTTIAIILKPGQSQTLPSRSPALQERCPSRPKMWSRCLCNRYSLVCLAVLSLVALCLKHPAAVQARSISFSLRSTGQHHSIFPSEEARALQQSGMYH